MGNEEMVEYLIKTGTIDKKVAKAMRLVDRREFMPKEYGVDAYKDWAQSIGEGQTISQPSIVGFMTLNLDVREGMTILEIGAGSGYQAAILGKLVGTNGKVYTIERIENLAKTARNNLKKVGIENVEVIVGDGSEGLVDKAPFDRIIVTAGSPDVPEPLVKQLKDGGKMIIPVGKFGSQELVLIEKNDEIKKKSLLPVAFVPLIGKFAYHKEEHY